MNVVDACLEGKTKNRYPVSLHREEQLLQHQPCNALQWRGVQSHQTLLIIRHLSQAEMVAGRHEVENVFLESAATK
jgi:hypothetical protein